MNKFLIIILALFNTPSIAQDVNAAVDARISAAIAAIPPYSGGGSSNIDMSFGGRLTTQSGYAVINQDQIGVQSIYYSPYGKGKTIPIKISGVWSAYSFLSSSNDQVGLNLNLAGSPNWAADSLHDVFAIISGGVLKLATREWDASMYSTDIQLPNVTPISTGTTPTSWLKLSNAFDGITSQSWSNSARLFPSNSSLSNCIGQDFGTPQSVSKVIITAANDNTLQVSGNSTLQIKEIASNDGISWTALGFNYLNSSITGGTYTIPVNEGNQIPYRYHQVCITGDPTYSINVAELQFFTKISGLRRLEYVDGIKTNDSMITVRIDASTTVNIPKNEATFLGLLHIDSFASGQVTTHVSYGSNRTYGIWNAQNQEDIILQAGVISPGISSYVLNSQRWQLAQTGFSLQIIQGEAKGFIPVSLTRGFYINAAPGRKVYEAGIAVDNTISFSGTEISAVIDNTGPQLGQFQTVFHNVLPFAGIKNINVIERTDSGAGVVSPFVELRSTNLIAKWKG